MDNLHTSLLEKRKPNVHMGIELKSSYTSAQFAAIPLVIVFPSVVGFYIET